ncbi:putative PAS domain, signal transduction response regulator, receiver domain, CheY-like superfamily [Septoria linicola]|nr:putative PAS domain, signal transduction response regulator, receiver domain, CheY-like superfamily [Septoria linicola]
MNSSLPPQETLQDTCDNDDTDPTPTDLPERPSAQQGLSSARPQLVRSPPGRLSELGLDGEDERQSEAESTDDGSNNDDGTTKSSTSTEAAATGEPKSRQMYGVLPQSQGNLADLKTALKRASVRPRNSYGTSSTAGKGKRVSPIKEETSGDSPVSSLNAVLGPTEPVRTTSTESTESARTIRGSVPPTPSGNIPLRTPSYPFPYVPGTPRSWSQNFHQPFTALSPTVTNQGRAEDETPGAKSSFSVLSGGSTPAANSAFMPPGSSYESPEDPRYPTPNLYDLVLQLNTEPGLDQWWATVTNILHDHFTAERASLVQPLDPSDIENVPWGQKATFSMNGREDFVPPSAFEQMHAAGSHRPDIHIREPSSDVVSDTRPQKLHPERLRPRLEARHSYAGHGREVRDVLGALNDPPTRTSPRPPGPQRTMTHTAGTIPSASSTDMPPKRFPSLTSVRQGSFNDPSFSSLADTSDVGPYAEVFTSIRPLDQESKPLIEPGGVCRVLDRGRVVAITRDYSGDENKPVVSRSAPSASLSATLAGNYRSAFAGGNTSQPGWGYHEYEQHPPSPWTQSPAPSPAIQADEEINPFFASDDQLLDESFNPAISPKDYSQYDQVEAIGIDHASTVIHIPLIHPTLSQSMQALRMTPGAKDVRPSLQRSGTAEFDRKAPIAILSILTATVPYPANFIKTLKLLGPHLATSFQNAQQFSATHTQAINIRHRRTTSGARANFAPMTIEPASLEDIANAELEELPSSITGSMTSPSDYSGRSRISPSGSIVGTPGWDPAAHGWTASRSRGNTPAYSATEMVDNYFDAKKRSGPRSGSNASTTMSVTPAKSSSKASSSESRADDDPMLTRGERKARAASNSKPARSPMQPSTTSEAGAQQPTETSSTQKSSQTTTVPESTQQSKRHSLLHSYGADFETSFGGLQASTSSEVRSSAHARKGSYSEDMPPPSERLLRTIIDSVPVQIFTAQPETGNLSWVNSKFLIYRGQDPTQVLNDPWAAIHPQDHREFLPAWQRSLRTNQQLQQKVRLKRFDGAYRWFYVRAAPLKDKKQKVVHWIGTLMDFHEQQIAEISASRQQETAASEAKYRALANSSPQIVFAVNKARGVTFCNTQWLQYSGQTEAHALGVGFMEHVHPDDLIKCKLPSFDTETKEPNVPTTLPLHPRRTVSNSEASTSGSSETEKPSSSSASGATSPTAIHHLPQRKLSQLATAGILKVTRDTDGRPSYSTEVRLKNRDGDFRWHLVRVLVAEPLLQHEDEEETWYGTCTDINDHKDLERDLKNTMDAKSRFLSNMSHEIRTPLNGITGMVNFLIDSSLTAEQMEHVNIIRASTEGLRGLINDILDLSKAEAGMIQLNMDWVYVRALIEEVNDLTSAMAIDKGLELNYIVDEDVPPQVKGDRFRIRQILLNVVGNAIKFTQKGEVFIRCSIHRTDARLEDDEMLIKFDVVDTGQGFTDKEADSLFKRFSQIDGSSTRQHGGTGLGLVISKQLAQLHGGDMSAKGVPEQGSTFTFYIRTALPSKEDRPPVPIPTPGAGPLSVPVLPVSPGPTPLSQAVSLPLSPHARLSPKYAAEVTQTPPQYPLESGTESPSVSSASSDPSVRSATRTASLQSERSSASSLSYDATVAGPQIKLAMPSLELMHTRSNSLSSRSIDEVTANASSRLAVPVPSPPPMFSILVIAPLKYSREATVQHIDKTLPGNVPHQITARESLADCQQLLAGPKPVIFTHIVAVLQDVSEIAALMDQVLIAGNSTTSVVLITDLAQRRKIMEQAPSHDYNQLVVDRKLRFVFKPLKPSRFGLIFDPQKEREMSLDRNQDSAQQVAVNQKQVFEELARRLGNKDKRVLLVEDNRVNQMVILKFLSKVSIKVDTVMDGVQCVDKVFAKPPNHYSIILCDLHMPNKDGYQTCKEIRKWEKHNKYAHLPIIALSANVLGDVYQKCVEAGFNSYMTKPVDFKELSQVLMTFMDPSDPSKPHAFMKLKQGQHSHKNKDASAAHGASKDKSKKLKQ